MFGYVALQDLGRMGMSHAWWFCVMMTSSNGNIFRITSPLWGEFTGHRWISLTKTSDVELWRFIWSAPEQRVEQTTQTLVIGDAVTLIMTSLNVILETYRNAPVPATDHGGCRKCLDHTCAIHSFMFMTNLKFSLNELAAFFSMHDVTMLQQQLLCSWWPVSSCSDCHRPRIRQMFLIARRANRCFNTHPKILKPLWWILHRYCRKMIASQVKIYGISCSPSPFLIALAIAILGISSPLSVWYKLDELSLLSAKLLYIYIDGLVQDCSNSIANALELLQSCTKPSIYTSFLH